MGGEGSALSEDLLLGGTWPTSIFWGGSGPATADQFWQESFRVFAKSCSYQYSHLN